MEYCEDIPDIGDVGGDLARPVVAEFGVNVTVCSPSGSAVSFDTTVVSEEPFCRSSSSICCRSELANVAAGRLGPAPGVCGGDDNDINESSIDRSLDFLCTRKGSVGGRGTVYWRNGGLDLTLRGLESDMGDGGAAVRSTDGLSTGDSVSRVRFGRDPGVKGKASIAGMLLGSGTTDFRDFLDIMEYLEYR